MEDGYQNPVPSSHALLTLNNVHHISLLYTPQVYQFLSLLCLKKSVSNVILFQPCSWPTSATTGDLPLLSKGDGEEARSRTQYLQVSCSPVQVEVDVFYFPILCKFVMDVFFSGFFMDPSDKKNPAFNSCRGREGGEHTEKSLRGSQQQGECDSRPRTPFLPVLLYCLQLPAQTHARARSVYSQRCGPGSSPSCSTLS